MGHRWILALVAASLLVLSSGTYSPTATAALPLPISGKVVKLTRVGGTFVAPVYVTSPPKDATRLFVATRSGVIWEVRGGV
ncbi:MAG TPA: hypothetical protein VGA13_06940, partial [Acidimicrobiales bacterium]